MGNVIKKSIIKHTLIYIISATAFMIISILLSYIYCKNNFDEKNARIEVNNIIYDIKNSSNVSNIKVKKDINFFITDTDGLILTTDMPSYPVNTTVDLHTVAGEKTFIVPIKYKNDTVLILYTDFKNYTSRQNINTFIVISVVCILIWLIFIITSIILNRTVKKDIIIPINQLHTSVKSILAGKLDTDVKYDYDGELGSLCHDFENMRSELEDSYKREEVLKDKIHIMYGSISHDLKTSLATITGYLEAIIYDVAKTPEDIKIYAKRSLNKSQIINKLIDDILEHSKAEVNNLSINKKEIYAQDFFSKLLNNYKEESENKAYTISYNLPQNILINIDTLRIAEVMQNLISNSIKYGRGKVDINIEFSQIETPYNMLLVSVKDNGPGIDAADLPFIFNSFYRGNKARTQDIPGSGLGLNICKYIVEAHEGKIECDSIVGKGTDISFSLKIS